MLSEFSELCTEIFDTRDGKIKFPEGCQECEKRLGPSDWNCAECPYRENYWKYDEVKRYVLLEQAQRGGMDLNRIRTLTIDDFLKVRVIALHMKPRGIDYGTV